jgi:voltage-gated potassium channel
MAKKKNGSKSKVVSKRSLIKLTDEDIISEKLMKKGAELEDGILKKFYGFLHLHVDNYASKHGRRIEGTFFLLNFLAIVLFIIDTHDIGPTAHKYLVIGEFILVAFFIFEYLARMWVAERRIKHLFSVYSIIDLLSIVPILANFGNLAFFRIFRILRLFRMLRILRFQRMFKEKDTMFGKISDTQLIVIRIVLSVFTIMFVSSGMIWAIESKINPGYGTIWNAMYFAVVTLSTVGYGDVTPLSPWGKVVTIVMILSGIAIIPWQLGKLVKVLFESATKTGLKCKKCGLQEHDKDSKHCKMCGTKLPKRKKGMEDI